MLGLGFCVFTLYFDTDSEIGPLLWIQYLYIPLLIK